jgi:hypothetical protein
VIAVKEMRTLFESLLIFGGTVAIGIVFGIMFSPRPFQGLLET